MKSKIRNRVSILLLLLMLLAAVTGIVAEAAGPPQPTGFYYTVRWGDTLSSIAYRFGTTTWAIAQANGLYNPDYIYAGQVLLIPTQPTWPAPPPSGFYYTVRPGDILSSIARRFGTTYQAIAIANSLLNPNCIFVGQKLVIPGYAPAPIVPTYAPPHIVPPAVPTVIPKPTYVVYPIIVPTPQVAVCDPRVSILYPTVNAKLDCWGTTFIKGTASIDNFWFYKLEFGCGDWPTEWSVIGELHYEPVVRGILGYWNTGALPEGVYTLRLVVVDKTGNYPEPCEVRVIIER